MPTPLYFPTTTNAVQKTLDAELLAGVTASATLNNVTGLQNKKGIMVIDRVDGNNNLTPSKREYISFDGTSGVTVTTLGRGLGGSTDQDHAVGAIVEFVNDVVQQQAIIDGLLLTVTPAGVLNRATGANINTGTDDDKIVTPKAIADSKVSIIDKAETLTNKTLTSPKINEDVALTTTATELNNLHSKTLNLGAWTTYVPSFTGLTVGSGTLVGKYIQHGKFIHGEIHFTFAADSSTNGAVYITLPVTSVSYSGTSTIQPIGIADCFESGGSGYPGRFNWNNTTTGILTIGVASGTYVVGAATSATVPFTWGTNDEFHIIFDYEAA